jgi:hypothetical protein
LTEIPISEPLVDNVGLRTTRLFPAWNKFHAAEVAWISIHTQAQRPDPLDSGSTDPGGVTETSRGSSAATPPEHAPQQRQHPEGGARQRGSQDQRARLSPDGPRTGAFVGVREAPTANPVPWAVSNFAG